MKGSGGTNTARIKVRVRVRIRVRLRLRLRLRLRVKMSGKNLPSAGAAMWGEGPLNSDKEGCVGGRTFKYPSRVIFNKLHLTVPCDLVPFCI